MSSPTIRQVTPDDLLTCARVYVEAFSRAPYYEGWKVEDARELLQALHEKEPDLGFCLDWNGVLVGFALCSTVGRFRAVVEEFALHPDYQGRGWGRLLLDHCLGIFQQRGYTRVDLLANLNAPAYGFYRKLGFRQSTRYVLMVKDI